MVNKLHMQHTLTQKKLPDAWISHSYMAKNNRGDQSRKPCRHASFIADITFPWINANRERTRHIIHISIWRFLIS